MSSLPPLRRLSEPEVEEFRKILNESAGKDFSLADAAKLTDMLMNALALVRDVAIAVALKSAEGRPGQPADRLPPPVYPESSS